jgi:hypothetical protein
VGSLVRHWEVPRYSQNEDLQGTLEAASHLGLMIQDEVGFCERGTSHSLLANNMDGCIGPRAPSLSGRRLAYANYHDRIYLGKNLFLCTCRDYPLLRLLQSRSPYFSCQRPFYALSRATAERQVNRFSDPESRSMGPGRREGGSLSTGD